MSDALTVQQSAAVLRQAGWPEVLIPVMVAIAKAESGLRPGAVNTANRNGTVDRGLLQINSSHGYDPDKLLADPVYNARAGLAIYNARKPGDGLNAWSTWKNHLVTARDVNAAAGELGIAKTTSSGGIVDNVGSAIGSAAGAVGGAAKDAAGAVAGVVTAPLKGLAADAFKVGLQLVLVAGAVGLVVLGVNAAAGSSKTVQNARQSAIDLAPAVLA